MKKALAAVGASVLGLAAAGTATSAQADPVLPADCANASDQTVSSSAVTGDDWYMDCVPQYGLGKVEFTIHAPDATFPAGFQNLQDLPASAVTSTTDPAVTGPYFSYGGHTAVAQGDFIDLVDTDDETDSQVYQGHLVSPVVSVAPVAVSDLPADCYTDNDVFTSAYKATYAATTTVFTETLTDGSTQTYTLSFPASIEYFGFTLTNHAIDGTQAACASDGTTVVTALEQNDYGWDLATQDHASTAQQVVFVPYNTFEPIVINGDGTDPFTLPPVTGLNVPVPPSPSPSPSAGTASDPALAATGQDSFLPFVAGTALIGAGGWLALYFGRRRRRHVAR